ncbi:hypothetical protein Taro_003508 [Colocasia esculenta]|uniref:Dirigent protein n=1 Tax=Colocasia esculenta TaxID=4460 RepID=A0A843TP70_COLES|nr:hypothetical protein [Colocasia esculenta]
MASAVSKSAFAAVLLLCYWSVSANTTRVHASGRRPFAMEVPVRRLREKTSHLRFYFHDIVSGRNPTAVLVTQPPKSLPFLFGAVQMMDDSLTVGPEPTSRPVGRAQGIYAFAAQEELGLLMLMNLVFTEGKYNGSVLSVMGRNPVTHPVREMAVVGGSGLFRFARGYALASTVWYDKKTNDATVGSGRGSSDHNGVDAPSPLRVRLRFPATSPSSVGWSPGFASVFGLASVTVAALVGWCSPALLLLIRGGLLEGGRRIPLVSASTAVREESILWWSIVQGVDWRFRLRLFVFSGLVLCCFSPLYLLGVDPTREVRMRLSSVSSPTPHLRWRTMWPYTLCILLLQGTMDVCMQPPVELFPGERVRGCGLPRREAVGEALRLFTAPCMELGMDVGSPFTLGLYSGYGDPEHVVVGSLPPKGASSIRLFPSPKPRNSNDHCRQLQGAKQAWSTDAYPDHETLSIVQFHGRKPFSEIIVCKSQEVII